MLKRYYFFIIFILLIIFTAVAQEENWDTQEEIQQKTTNDIINDPQNAQAHWQDLTEDQKNNVYARSDGLKLFSQEFSKEKGLKGFDASLGNAFYGNGYLKNGDSSFPVEYLKGAEIKSLQNGGFEIKFPDNSILNDLQFNGGTNGITFEGNNLKLDQNLLLNGEVTIFDASHFRIEPNSEFQTSGIAIKTEAQGIDIYYGNDAYANNFIRIHDNELEIVGNGLEVKLLENSPFKIMSVDGAVKIVDGDFVMEFDGKGNAYQDLLLGEPQSDITITDEASGKEYILVSDEESENPHVEGTCLSISGATGDSVLDISGRVVESICKGVVKTGEYVFSSIWAGGNVYNAKLSLNEEQLQSVYDQFKQENGREPDIYDENDMKKIGELIKNKVTDIKLEQKFLDSKSLSESQAKSLIEGWYKNAGFSLTEQDKTELKPLYEKLSGKGGIIIGDTLEYQISGNKGLVLYKPVNGDIASFSLPSRLVSPMLQNFYNINVDTDKTEPRELLKNSIFGRKRIALK